MKKITNGKVTIGFDEALGQVVLLNFASDKHGMNYLISPETLKRYEYDDAVGKLLGGSLITYCGHRIDTGLRKPDKVEETENGVSFTYELNRLLLTHTFRLVDEQMHWEISLTNTHTKALELEELVHWMPTGYVMHKTVEENLHHSCAMVPSITGSHPYVICKKRSGEGRNLIVFNKTGEMKSVGSFCRFTNLFFEQSSPSLNGLILFNTVNAYKIAEMRPAAKDWQYKEMYRSIGLQPGEVFRDGYIFATCEEGEEEACVLSLGGSVVDFEPNVFVGQKSVYTVRGAAAVRACRVFAAGKEGPYEENVKASISGRQVTLEPFAAPGERKIVFDLEDGTQTSVIFAVYTSIRDIIDAICDYIYTDRFENDPDSPEYCAYKSTSIQGESCAKGTLLLLKNQLSGVIVPEEIRQVERNVVNFILPNWLDDEFRLLKKYPGGFARMGDLSYIIPQIFLLSKFEGYTEIHPAETYLLWAYKLAVYSMVDTPDKGKRERDELGSGWYMVYNAKDIADALEKKGYAEECAHLCRIMSQPRNRRSLRSAKEYMITEHYFDNAGLSGAQYLFESGQQEKGMEVAKLLIPNVAPSNDYRNYAPDRWWEALAPMYHNLWCVKPARAMLSAYEYSKDNRYLFSAYRGMVPMFYNYDWNAVSAVRELKMGEGVSAYCLTSPNMNVAYCSHNRFGQQVFRGDDFFDRSLLQGDDWDMGMDVIVYLLSFGRKSYVTMVDGKPVAVNGRLEGDSKDMVLTTYAPYGSEFYFEPFDLTVACEGAGCSVESLRISDAACVEVTVRGEGELKITAGVGAERTVIQPRIIRK